MPSSEMLPETTKVFTLKSRPDGAPSRDNFELCERQMPEPAGQEVLVETLYLSVDPYMQDRIRNRDTEYSTGWDIGQPARARVVGEVVESRHEDVDRGELVTGNLYWSEYATVPGDEVRTVEPGIAPVETVLGPLGTSGLTAYFGMVDVGAPTPGDTVVVSAAAGSVGSIAAQIAKMAGCETIGIAGSEEKIDYLQTELGLDDGINYSKVDDRREMEKLVSETVPGGIDLYFDNVGGMVTDGIIPNLDFHATIVGCGQVSVLTKENPVGPRHFEEMIEKSVTFEGYLVGEYREKYDVATERLAQWIAEDELVYDVDVTEGFERIPEAFLDLFEGNNVGKKLVKVSDRT